MKAPFLFLSLLGLFPALLSAQSSDPFIRLTEPLKEMNPVSSNPSFIIGSTCKKCKIDINGKPVKVYPTGAFAHELILVEGDSLFTITAVSPQGVKQSRTLRYQFRPPVPETATAAPDIDRIQVTPTGNQLLSPGDRLQFRVKAFPGATVTMFRGTPLIELPVSQTGGLRGIYQGEYVVQPTDSFRQMKWPVMLTTSDGTMILRETQATYSVMDPRLPQVVMTRGRLAHLEYGWGEDRLGGAKMGYVDSLIPLRVIGKSGNDFRVRLAPSRTAYIPDDVVTEMPSGTLAPVSLTGKIKVYGDSLYDYVNLQLFSKLPYQTFHQTDPTALVVDVFGATGNTNWIDHLLSAREVRKVEYEQLADEIFRVKIFLKHIQPWGHRLYYQGNNLIVQVRRPPAKLYIRGLRVAIDAGHGGSNTGAAGPTGIAEKELTLMVSLRLRDVLEQQGAKVTMTRTEERFFDNKERILFYRDSLPDVLLSIHFNSSADPIRVGGTSTFYRHEGFRPLSYAIYRHLLQLGLKDAGNNGSFNFMLNSPTEYPNALLELLYLSNPEEEAKILDPAFREQMVQKIVEGLREFLQEARAEW